MGFSFEFAKILRIPADIINDDTYAYLTCKKNGFKFCFAKSTIAWYRTPSTLGDHLSQSLRYVSGGKQLSGIFGTKALKQSFALPKSVQIKIMFYQIRKNPLGYLFIKFVNFYIFSKTIKSDNSLNGVWPPILSSKQLL